MPNTWTRADLTFDALTLMSAGHELDTWVCRLILNLPDELAQHLQFSTHPQDAQLVLDNRRLHWRKHGGYRWRISDLGAEGWRVEIVDGQSPSDALCGITADTLPLAICQAALAQEV